MHEVFPQTKRKNRNMPLHSWGGLVVFFNDMNAQKSAILAGPRSSFYKSGS